MSYSYTIKLLRKYKCGIDYDKFLAYLHKRNYSLISSSCPGHEIKTLRIEKWWKRRSLSCYVFAFACCKCQYLHLSCLPLRSFQHQIEFATLRAQCLCSWHSADPPPTLGIVGLRSLQVLSSLQTSANIEQHFNYLSSCGKKPKYE